MSLALTGPDSSPSHSITRIKYTSPGKGGRTTAKKADSSFINETQTHVAKLVQILKSNGTITAGQRLLLDIDGPTKRLTVSLKDSHASMPVKQTPEIQKVCKKIIKIANRGLSPSSESARRLSFPRTFTPSPEPQSAVNPAAMEELRSQIDRLTDEKTGLTHRVEDLTGQVRGLAEENARLVQENTQCSASQEELTGTLKTQLELYGAAKQKIRDLDERIEQLQKELSELQKSSVADKAESAARIGELEKAVNADQAEIAALKNTKSELEANIATANAEIDRLRSELTKATKRAAELEAQLAAAQDDKTSDKTALETRIQELEQAFAKAQNEVAILQKEKVELEDYIEQILPEIDVLTTELENANKRVAELETQLASEKFNFEKRILELEHDVSEAERKITELSAQKPAYPDRSTEVTALSKQLETQRAANLRLALQVSELEHAFAHKEIENGELVEQAQSLASRVEDLNAEFVNLKDSESQAKQQLTSVTQRFKESEERNLSFDHKIGQNQTAYDQASAHAQREHDREIGLLKQQMSMLEKQRNEAEQLRDKQGLQIRALKQQINKASSDSDDEQERAQEVVKASTETTAGALNTIKAQTEYMNRLIAARDKAVESANTADEQLKKMQKTIKAMEKRIRQAELEKGELDTRVRVLYEMLQERTKRAAARTPEQQRMLDVHNID